MTAFYTEYLSGPIGGLVRGRDLSRLAPFLSERLHRSIVEALAYDREFLRLHPDEKPPFADGDHFSSLFEGPRWFTVTGATELADGVWRVDVRFWYEAGSEGWSDAILVVADRGQYRIDDVLYGGAGPFNPAGRLTEKLQWREGAPGSECRPTACLKTDGIIIIVEAVPRLVKKVQPVYPESARRDRIEGTVNIDALVDESCRIVSACSDSQPDVLRRAAVEAVMQWRYTALSNFCGHVRIAVRFQAKK